ncbi:MAG: DegT/DnrJ/EryC1/StrS family aminotransferase [Eubacteriales bacterium]|nr:DegT/DnrJ/EryC1/StrS family aminotransferase [Eubacteriales bacterium]
MARLAINGGEAVNPNGHIKFPVISEQDKEYVMRALEEGVLWGPYAPQVKALEKEWAEFVGTKYCLSCNSGTAALTMSLAAAGIGPGDEVLSPSLNFVACAMAVLHCNGIPKFVDVDPKTFCMDPKKIEAKITEKTKAIIPVDLHGITADMDEINSIAKKYHLIVIADSCQAHGATYKGKNAGTLADMSVFSLNGLKNLPGGDGGLFNTDDEEYFVRANQCRMFGEVVREGVPRDYNSSGVGYMYRYFELPAAFVRSRLTSLRDDNALRRSNAQYLAEKIGGLKGLAVPHIPENRQSVYHYFRIRFSPKELGISMDPNLFRAKLQKALVAEGVAVSRWQTRPVQLQTLFQERTGYGKGCPWSCPYTSGEKVEYGPEDYEVTKQILADSLVLYDSIYPPNGHDLMDRYAEALNKMWENMDEVLGIEVAPDDMVLRD